MSLMSSLYSAASGLETSTTDLSVIGDNIANANTIGFKGSRAAFEDALSQSIIGTGGQIGLGARLQAVQRIVTQGALTTTGLATDLALDGNGFFMVRGTHNGANGAYYTRAGQFTLDDEGYLVNLEGLRVQGYGANPTGDVQPTLGDLRVGEASSAPNPTANIAVKANLQSDAEIMPPWDPNDPAGTSNFSTSVTAYDSLGKAHQIDVYYARTGVNTWEWHALTDGAGINGGSPGIATEVASGTLDFDATGLLVAQSQTSDFNPDGAVAPQALTFDFGDAISDGGTGAAGITQFASPSAVTFVNQDGYASGDLANIRIDTEGNVIGAFSNGQARVLGQVAVADFDAPDRLERVGGNLFIQMPASGDPAIGHAGEGGRAAIVAGALEQSNVDLASEFIRMIAAQRGFQANSKTVTTADQLLSELIQMKRY